MILRELPVRLGSILTQPFVWEARFASSLFFFEP